MRSALGHIPQRQAFRQFKSAGGNTHLQMGFFMIKIRLSGSSEEVNLAILTLVGIFDVVNVSDFYKNHGNDNTIRAYLDANIIKGE